MRLRHLCPSLHKHVLVSLLKRLPFVAKCLRKKEGSYLSHSTKRVPFGSATFDEMHKAQTCPKMCLQSLKLFIQVLLLT